MMLMLRGAACVYGFPLGFRGRTPMGCVSAGLKHTQFAVHAGSDDSDGLEVATSIRSS